MICIVNDNALQRRLQADLIESVLGERVRMFEDGADLVEALEAQMRLPAESRRLPACILLNNFMHRMHGPQALLRLRRMEREHGLNRTPVVVLSAFFTKDERQLFRRHADAIFPVPFRVEDFLATLRRLLGKARGG